MSQYLESADNIEASMKKILISARIMKYPVDAPRSAPELDVIIEKELVQMETTRSKNL